MTINKNEDYHFLIAWMRSLFVISFISLISAIIWIPYTLDFIENYTKTEMTMEYYELSNSLETILTLIILNFIALLIIFILFMKARISNNDNSSIIDKRSMTLLLSLFLIWFFSGGSFIIAYLLSLVGILISPVALGQDILILLTLIPYFFGLLLTSNVSLILMGIALAFLSNYLVFKKINLEINFDELFPLSILLMDLAIVCGTIRFVINPGFGIWDDTFYLFWAINLAMLVFGIIFMYFGRSGERDEEFSTEPPSKNKTILSISSKFLMGFSILTGSLAIFGVRQFINLDYQEGLLFNYAVSLVFILLQSIILTMYGLKIRNKAKKML